MFKKSKANKLVSQVICVLAFTLSFITSAAQEVNVY
jgi:hypothetical protein